ncbi:hypothetical protein H0O00_02315 [Candidatus Micrarchaeota archaeon]|nr:hypothetical protein [Candidatus Micrarchaeota archaeon]
MNKYKLMSYIFVLLGILVVVGSLYVIINYASDLINAIVNFVTTNDYSKLQQCGVSYPSQFDKLKAEFATLILPALFIGLPLLLIVLSAVMFIAGFYYQKGKLQDDVRKHEELKREMVHKIRKKMGVGVPEGSAPQPKAEAGEELEEEEPEEEELPQQKPTPKKK